MHLNELSYSSLPNNTVRCVCSLCSRQLPTFMEILLSSEAWLSILVALFLVLVVAATQLKKSKRGKAAPLPPGPRRLPVLGNLHNLLGSKAAPHKRLAELSKEYGPLMHLQVGQRPTVVISSPDMAQPFLTAHELNFADRPAMFVPRQLAYNCRDVVFAPYGEYWRVMKKIVVVELLTARRVESLRHVREAAVSELLDVVARAGPNPVDFSKNFYMIGNWAVSRAIFGNANGNQHQLDFVVQVMNEIVTLIAGITLADFFPALESIISAATGIKRRLREVFMKMDGLFDDIIKEHMSRFDASDVSKDDGSLISLLLKHYRLQDLEFPLSINDIKAVVMDLFVAGTDSTSSILDWALAEMMKNRDVMHKAQSEARRVYREKGKMDETAVGELRYLKQVVKEVLRLHPPLPLIPRQCRETSEINGYQIPAKTRVFVNAWALGRDPKWWPKPDQFDPERFRDGSLSYKGRDCQFVPFGAGRRMCPGAIFGLANIEITLAKILCHFNLKLPDGLASEDLNMEETGGASMHKKVPLCLIASTHIPF